MVRYYSVTFKRGLFMVAYSDSKEKWCTTVELIPA